MTEVTNATPSRWRELVSREYLPYSVIFGGGVVLHAMNVFVSATILPSVVAEIGGLNYYSWSTTFFVLFSIVGAGLTSRVKNAVGARGAYLSALVLFALGTSACASAWNISILNAGRAVQGAGGGMLYALAYTVIRMVFPNRLWALAIGFITLMWGVATLLGPAVGGVFAQYDNWRMAFYSLLPFAAVIALLSNRFIPGKQREVAHTHKKEAIPSLQLLAMVGVVVAVSLVAADPTDQNLFFGLLACGVAGFLGVWAERNLRAKLMPTGGMSFLSPFGALYACIAFLLIGMQPETFVPYFLQVLHGQSPLAAGYIGALMAVGWTLASAISAGYTGRKAERTLSLGAAFSFLGLLVQTVFLPEPSASFLSLIPICLGLLLVGFGIGYCWPHLTTKIYRSAPQQEEDLAASAITTVQLFATALGAGLAGLVANRFGMQQADVVEGASSAAFWMSLIFLVAPLASMFFAARASTQTPKIKGVKA